MRGKNLVGKFSVFALPAQFGQRSVEGFERFGWF